MGCERMGDCGPGVGLATSCRHKPGAVCGILDVVGKSQRLGVVVMVRGERLAAEHAGQAGCARPEDDQRLTEPGSRGSRGSGLQRLRPAPRRRVVTESGTCSRATRS